MIYTKESHLILYLYFEPMQRHISHVQHTFLTFYCEYLEDFVVLSWWMTRICEVPCLGPFLLCVLGNRPVQSVHLVTGDRRYKLRRMSSVTLFSPPQLVVLLILCRPKWIILSWKVGGVAEPQRAAANFSADLVKPWLRSASYLSSNAAQGECGHLIPQPVRFIPSLPLCLSPSLSSTHLCAHVHTYTQWPFKVFPGYFLVN